MNFPNLEFEKLLIFDYEYISVKLLLDINVLHIPVSILYYAYILMVN